MSLRAYARPLIYMHVDPWCDVDPNKAYFGLSGFTDCVLLPKETAFATE